MRVAQPQGGFYLFPDFSPLADRLAQRGIRTSEQLTTALLEATGACLLAGTAFGVDSSLLAARLAYVDFDGTRALASGDADTRHMDEGIEKLCAWLAD